FVVRKQKSACVILSLLVLTRVIRQSECNRDWSADGCSSDLGVAPRAVLGSRRPRTQGRAQTDSTQPAWSNALRAEDGSRSGPLAASRAVVAVSRRARKRQFGTILKSVWNCAYFEATN